MRVQGAACRVLGIALLAMVVSAHVGSPDVFFVGRAGPYDIKVVVRPPEVVPGVARVTVRTPADVRGVSIRPVFWRAGSRGAPASDEMRRLQGDSLQFEGSLWLMARGAYTVDVIVDGARGTANVLVPVASVATGRLALDPVLGGLLAAFGLVLVAGLINIVQKGAGESLLEPGQAIDSARVWTARRAGAVAVVVLSVAILGGARWWRAVDRDYERAMYRPSPLAVSVRDGVLRVAASDTLYLPGGRASRYVPDHGKLMHLFLVREDDARAFAHLHPQPVDSSEIPAFMATLPPLPAGAYRVYGDVVHETGFERTLVGSLAIGGDGPTTPGRRPLSPDVDDAWFVGDAATSGSARLADGSTMSLTLDPATPPTAGDEVTIRISVNDPGGKPAALEPYLGMAAHAVVARLDGAVYVHLHPMGTVTNAAQEVFRARDRGDTTPDGILRLRAREGHAPPSAVSAQSAGSAQSASPAIEFPYAFPKSGSYRVFAQVKRNGRVLTGAFAIAVSDRAAAP